MNECKNMSNTQDQICQTGLSCPRLNKIFMLGIEAIARHEHHGGQRNVFASGLKHRHSPVMQVSRLEHARIDPILAHTAVPHSSLRR